MGIVEGLSMRARYPCYISRTKNNSTRIGSSRKCSSLSILIQIVPTRETSIEHEVTTIHNKMYTTTISRFQLRYAAI